MSVSERQRRNVFVKLKEVLGEETADHLMQLLPRTPNNELATREDVLASGTLLRGEMAELRAELRGEMTELKAELRGEVAELRAELRGEMTELRGEMAELRAELRGEMAELQGSVQRWMATVVAANAVTVLTVLVT